MKPDLRFAYEKADYAVSGITFHVGEPNAALARRVATTAAYITAANPHSNVQPPLANQLAHRRLEELVAGYPCDAAESRDPVRQFPPEKGLLVRNIALADAMAIGRVLGQNAIVFIEKNRPPELIVL